ncbi:hypothetical protein [Clostridium sp.]|uniref:hypothetical protein n=1 Tax=Clostridium sp. TaxID=1506 RepID=UPI002852CA7E|nr:hypothetical protein [Clostridium sp.]
MIFRQMKYNAFINEYYQVTHNYIREYKYNMWFTVIAHSKAIDFIIFLILLLCIFLPEH